MAFQESPIAQEILAICERQRRPPPSRQASYPLVNIHSLLWKITIFNGNSTPLDPKQ